MTDPDIDHDGDVDDADIAAAIAAWSGPDMPTTNPAADMDGDGDVDDADLARIFAAYTGPAAPPVTVDARDINADLRSNDRVDLRGIDRIVGGLVLPREYHELVCTEGDRPVIELADRIDRPEDGGHAIEITHRHTHRIHISGIAAVSPHRDQARGVRLRLSSKAGQFARRVEIIDCDFAGFDNGIEIVDDLPRRGEYAPGKPGRIGLVVGLCIITRAHGNDSHSGGIYAEGLEYANITDTAFDQIGWLIPSDRNWRSHCIYAQQYNGPVHCDGLVMSRAAANALQLRAGGSLRNSIATQCSLGPYIGGAKSVVENNVVLDQVDIQDIAGYDAYDRGHGLIFGGYNHTVRHNLLARRHGSLETIPALKDWHGKDDKTPDGNIAVAWAASGHNFNINGRVYTDIGTNRTVTSDPGVPHFTDIDRYTKRRRGEPYPGTQSFIARCWGAV